MQLGLPFGDAATERGRVPPAGAIAAPDEVVFVRHRRARRYVLRVCPDGRVRVTIPRGGSRREAGAFLERHRDWVVRQRATIARQAPSSDVLSAHVSHARSQLPIRLLAHAERLGLQVARITIRNQHTRWGSCGRNGHITLNWRLVLMPDWVSDYVLIHELMHLRRMDHSPRFWQLVSDAYPRYREARAWLRAHGPGLR